MHLAKAIHIEIFGSFNAYYVYTLLFLAIKDIFQIAICRWPLKLLLIHQATSD